MTFENSIIYFTCISACPHLFICRACLCLVFREEGLRFRETEVSGDCESFFMYWEQDPGPEQKQLLLLTAEPLFYLAKNIHLK